MTKLSKILRIVAAAAFLTALAVNVKVTLTDPFVKIDGAVIAQTTSDSANIARCLCNYIYKAESHPKHVAKCYREAYGPDIFEGYVNQCITGGPGCQPTYCKEILGQCYKVDET